jgi:pyridoxine 5-phosphate synthase
VAPHQATLVPERREEVTTEGGLDVVGSRAKVADAVRRLKDAGIIVSLFLDPDPAQIDAGVELGAQAIELHTGVYAHASMRHHAQETQASLEILIAAGRRVRAAGLTLDAGHGLTYRNVKPVAVIDGMHELNIGHSIIARAIMVGLEQAVRDMKRLIV